MGKRVTVLLAGEFLDEIEGILKLGVKADLKQDLDLAERDDESLFPNDPKVLEVLSHHCRNHSNLDLLVSPCPICVDQAWCRSLLSHH